MGVKGVLHWRKIGNLRVKLYNFKAFLSSKTSFFKILNSSLVLPLTLVLPCAVLIALPPLGTYLSAYWEV